MTVVSFPVNLPGPSVSTVDPAERRILSDVNGGPQQARSVQRDYLGTQRLEWKLLSATEAASFDAWWKSTLTDGGAWFSSTWPSPQGWVALIRRFIGVPQWTHLPGGFWRVNAQVQVRGQGLAPIGKTTWLSERSNGASLTNGLLTAVSNGPVAYIGVMAMAGDEHSVGKWYLEYSIDKASAGSACVPGLGFGKYPFIFSPNHATPSDTSFYADSIGGSTASPSADATATFVTGDVVMHACDLDTGKFWAGINGTWRWSGDPAAGLNPRSTLALGTYAPLFWDQQTVSDAATIRSLSRQFSYAPPTGFNPWGGA
jgi:hypothetical protein